MASPIPIRNVYYLLCYAWDRLEEAEIVDVARLDSTETTDLFAYILASGIHRLLRRGLDQGYIEQEEEIAGVRGRLNVGGTARRMLAQHGRSLCRYDELDVDTLPNRILKSTISMLARAPQLDGSLRRDLISVKRELGDVREIFLKDADFKRVQLYQNNRTYRFLLDVYRLSRDSMLVDEVSGDVRFRDFVRDERKMAGLFEAFVFNFLAKERKDLGIKRDLIEWNASSTVDPHLDFLPMMKTDISVRTATRTLVIDTKYYSETLQAFYDKRSVHSANLYQLYSYLKNLEVRDGPDALADGVLLYPVVQEPIDLRYEVPGHSIRVCTIDLGADWREIRTGLLDLVSEVRAS